MNLKNLMMWGLIVLLVVGLFQLFQNPKNIPKIIYSKTRKGRGYQIYDSKSHGAAHKRNSELFWKTKKDFSDKYSIDLVASAPTNQRDVFNRPIHKNIDYTCNNNTKQTYY